MSNKNNLPLKLTREQINRLLDWFDSHSFIIVDRDNIGDVSLPEVNPEYIRESLEEGI